jgi:hypothetical protein
MFRSGFNNPSASGVYRFVFEVQRAPAIRTYSTGSQHPLLFEPVNVILFPFFSDFSKE